MVVIQGWWELGSLRSSSNRLNIWGRGGRCGLVAVEVGFRRWSVRKLDGKCRPRAHASWNNNFIQTAIRGFDVDSVTRMNILRQCDWWSSKKSECDMRIHAMDILPASICVLRYVPWIYSGCLPTGTPDCGCATPCCCRTKALPPP